jgi:HD superfamily phosphodiesterase
VNNYDLILKEIEHFVTEEFSASDLNKFPYHNFQHTKQVVDNALTIAKNELLNYSVEDAFLLEIAAWFHDLGHLKSTNKHEEKSVAIALNFLARYSLNEQQLNTIKSLILKTSIKVEPESALEKVLKDADLMYLGTSDFFRQGSLLRKELAIQKKVTYNEEEWLMHNLQFLENHNFYTQYCRINLSDAKEKNIHLLKQQLAGVF